MLSEKYCGCVVVIVREGTKAPEQMSELVSGLESFNISIKYRGVSRGCRCLRDAIAGRGVLVVAAASS